MSRSAIETITTEMSVDEKKASFSLAFLYALRMLGLFMVLPVMMIEGQKLEGASVSLLGLAMGVYGLTQALLQIPSGALSDRIGRKPVIVGGLLIFALGSVIAAMADSVWMMIVGRALQGAGAIASAIMALLTDLTRDEHRMKAMATVGVSIGMSFSVALILGPWLASIGGLTFIFAATAALALVGVLVVLLVIPSPQQAVHNRDASASWGEVLKQFANPQLWPLNIGIFILHALMVGVFVAIPKELVALGVESSSHSWLYLPVLLVAFVLMVPFIILAEKRRKMKGVVILGALIISFSLVLMIFSSAVWHWIVAMLLYFWGFNLMEASLPSWLSKVAPAGAKGSAMGIYSSMQFMGAFVGGALGGRLFQYYGSATLFLIWCVAVLLWVVYLAFSPAPKHLSSVRISLQQEFKAHYLTALSALGGVSDSTWVEDENAIYLKVDADVFDHDQALAIVH